MNLDDYTGIGQFGRAWQTVMEHDPHAPGSVDRALMERMVRICDETANLLYDGFTPTWLGEREDVLPLWKLIAEGITAGGDTDEARVERIAQFTASLAEGLDPDDLDAVVLGGLEAEIIARGSNWCTDVARVGCVLCQAACIPARMIYLFNTTDPYCGHVCIEAYRQGAWGAVDTSTRVVYRHVDGRPATTWNLMCDARLVEAHRRPGATYTTPGQFRGAALANYSVWERHRYDYGTSGVNDYYRSILEAAGAGWPGGRRWLHGEDGY